MPSSALREKSAGFAKDIVFTVRDLREKHVESILPAFLLQHRVLLPFASNTARPALRVSITLKLPSS